jgi:hypothetical protein
MKQFEKIEGINSKPIIVTVAPVIFFMLLKHCAKMCIDIMKGLEQSSLLHPLIKHPETDMSRPGKEPWPPVSQAGTLPKS